MRTGVSKRRTIFLLVLALVAALLGGCRSTADGAPAAARFSGVENGAITETQLTVADPTQAALVRERMKRVLSDGTATLYIGQAHDVALVDERTGAVWFSNEGLYDEGADAYSADQKKYAFSQLIVQYYRSDNVAVEVTSYPECYDGGEKDQVTETVEGNTLTVRYAFGTDMDSRVIFQVLTAETFQRITELAEKAIADKTVSSSEWGRMKAAYNTVVYDELDAKERQSYTERFSTFGAGDTLYVLNPAATYIQTDNIEKVCKRLGLTRADVDAEETKAGGSGSLTATVPNFVIEIRYTLDSGDLLVSVDIGAIYEPENFYLNRVSVLPAFGATENSADGYLLLPDGAGHIVPHTTVPEGSDHMTIAFYGDDAAIETEKRSDQTPAAAFPVFGIRQGEQGLFAVVESGDGISGVEAQLANQNHRRNTVSPYFNYRVRGQIKTGAGSDNKNYVYSQQLSAEPYAIRYHLLYGGRSTYSGMAAYYREYLTATGGMKRMANGSSYFMEIYAVGALTGQKTVLGVTTEAALAASDLTSVQEWMRTAAIPALSVQYEGLFNGGVDGSAPTKLRLVQALGSAEELRTVLASGGVTPVLSFQSVAKSGNGIRSSTDLAKTVSKTYAFLGEYNAATGLVADSGKRFLLSPRKYAAVTEKLAAAYTAYGCDRLVLREAASVLLSDFSDKQAVNREDAKQLVQQALQLLEQSGLQLTLEGANAYALPYAAALSAVPDNTAPSSLSGQAIPFVGMVLHGSLPYAAAPLNEAECYEDAVLALVESGASPAFRIITGDMAVLSDTEYSRYYSASAAYWTEKIQALDARLSRFGAAVATAELVEHTVSPDGITQVRYSNGCCALINKSTETAAFNGIEVAGKAFRLFNGEGEEL